MNYLHHTKNLPATQDHQTEPPLFPHYLHHSTILLDFLSVPVLGTASSVLTSDTIVFALTPGSKFTAQTSFESKGTDSIFSKDTTASSLTAFRQRLEQRHVERPWPDLQCYMKHRPLSLQRSLHLFCCVDRQDACVQFLHIQNITHCQWSHTPYMILRHVSHENICPMYYH